MRGRFKLRHFVRRAVHVFTQNKRKKLAALVFATSVWLRAGVVPQQGVQIAHAMEQVMSSELVLGGDQIVSDEVVDGSFDGIAETVEVEAPGEQSGVNRKVLATAAGAVVLPSTGLLLVRGRGQRAPEEADVEKNDDSPTSKEDRSLVPNVQGKPKKTPQRVDADTFMKSVQKEKSIIASAISRIKKQLESDKEQANANRSFQAEDQVGATFENNSAERDTIVAEEDCLSNNPDLPLMTPQFIRARQQPKDPAVEQLLQQKYQAIEDLELKAFAILVDLGMIETDDESIVVGLP